MTEYRNGEELPSLLASPVYAFTSTFAVFAALCNFNSFFFLQKEKKKLLNKCCLLLAGHSPAFASECESSCVTLLRARLVI